MFNNFLYSLKVESHIASTSNFLMTFFLPSWPIEANWSWSNSIAIFKLFASSRGSSCLYRNPDLLVDPIRDFKAGVTIKLPSAEAVKLITGGN